MKLFKLDNDYNIVPEKDTIMLVPEFKALWTMKYNRMPGDIKGIDRRRGTAEIQYLYFYCDYRSEFSELNDGDRKMSALNAAGLEESYGISSELADAVSKYMKLQETRELRLLDSSFLMIDKLDDFFKDVDVNHANFEKCMKHLGSLGKTLENLKGLQNQVRKQEGANKGIRGDHEQGFLK